MKKTHLFSTLLVASSLSFSSCGVPGSTGTGTSTTSTATTDALSSILGSLLGGLLSSNMTQQTLIGSWTYQAPEVRFESENLLAKAGGEVAAASIEQKLGTYLSKVGISAGTTTYTFNQDNTFSIQTGNRTVSTGTYTFDANNKILKMQGTLGLMNQTCTVGMDGTNLCLLFDADKMLTAVNALSSVLGKSNSTIGSVAGVLGSNYKGMKLGFQMSK